MARIDPKKLVRKFSARSGNPQEVRLNWELPVELDFNEELVVTRRKDAFPVEIRNKLYDDRYTDVAQVEVFRGNPIYASNLIPNGNELTIGSGNQFFPSSITEFDINNDYKGRLIRDSLGNVYRVAANTETTITLENLTDKDEPILPPEGEFVILADYSKEISPQREIELLPETYTLKIESNTFVAGDKITINNTIELEYLVDWNLGSSPVETLRNISRAIVESGVRYELQQFGDILLVRKGSEETLIVESNTSELLINDYAISGNKIYIQDGLFTRNELRHQVLSFAGQRFFVKENAGREITLFKTLTYNELPNVSFTKLSNFKQGITSFFKDTFKTYLEILTRKPTGLDEDIYYYYTAFNAPKLSEVVYTNENSSNPGVPLKYTADKVDVYTTRVFYEDLIFTNTDLEEFTYDDVTGQVTFTSGIDLSDRGIQVGDLFGDSRGRRIVITDISNLDSGIVGLATGLDVSEEVIRATHGVISRSNIPDDFNLVEVDDTFKDLANNSFRVVGTFNSPTVGLTATPSNAIDVSQGLVDKVIVKNDLLVPFTFNPEASTVQYGQRSISLNRLLASYTYNSITGIIQYSGTTINLVPVAVGDFFVDGVGNTFEILEVNQANQTVTLDAALSVNNTVNNDRSGSIIRIEGFTDIEGNLLIDLTAAQPTDLLRLNGGNTVEIDSIDVQNARLTIDSSVTEISTTVEDSFSGTIIRRGVEVQWIGTNDELIDSLQNTAQGGVKRNSSPHLAQYALFSNTLSTQAFTISTQDRELANYIYGLFPRHFRSLDTTGDLEDLTRVFGNELNNMFSVVNTYELQNADLIPTLPLRNAASSKGVGLTSETLGIDTRRRIVRDIQSAFNKKGTRQGIFEYIKILTTWDITNGTGDIREAIIDDSPEAVGLKFYSPALGSENTRLVDTLDVQSPPAGRFYKGLPGITLPGFFNFTEVLITLPNIALEIGNSTDINFVQGETTISDDAADFGNDNTLIGSFIIPNEGNSNDFYEIVANTKTTITVRGSVPLEYLGAKYVVLSQLNLNRFTALNSTLPNFLPYNTIPVFIFTLTT